MQESNRVSLIFGAASTQGSEAVVETEKCKEGIAQEDGFIEWQSIEEIRARCLPMVMASIAKLWKRYRSDPDKLECISTEWFFQPSSREWVCSAETEKEVLSRCIRCARFAACRLYRKEKEERDGNRRYVIENGDKFGRGDREHESPIDGMLRSEEVAKLRQKMNEAQFEYERLRANDVPADVAAELAGEAYSTLNRKRKGAR